MSVEGTSDVQGALEDSLRRANAREHQFAIYAELWERYWPDVHVSRFVVAPEAKSTKEVLAAAVMPALFPAMVDLWLNYASVLALAEGPAASYHGQEWSVHMTKRSWQRFCQRLARDGLTANQSSAIFKEINEISSKAYKDAKIDSMHKGISSFGAHGAETALTGSTFSISEFIEALFHIAVVVSAASSAWKKEPLGAEQLTSVVVRFLSEVILPHCAQLGLSDFRTAMVESPKLNRCLLDFAPVNAKMYVAFARVAANEEGVSLRHFIELANLVTVKLSRSRVKAVFVQSLPINQLYSPDSSKLLSPAHFQEAILRLAVIQADLKGTAEDDELAGAELHCPAMKLDAAQLAKVRAGLHTIELLALQEQQGNARASSRKELEATAATMIQCRQRGHSARSFNA